MAATYERTFAQNLSIIRGNTNSSNIGTVVRSAIAEGLEQCGDELGSQITAATVSIYNRINNVQSSMASLVSAATTSMNNSIVAAKSSMNAMAQNAKTYIDTAVGQTLSTVNGEINRIETKVDQRNIYMSTTKLTGADDEWLLTITNPS